MEIYGRVRRAVLVEGKSERAVAQEFGIARETVRKMLRYSVPPGLPAGTVGKAAQAGAVDRRDRRYSERRQEQPREATAYGEADLRPVAAGARANSERIWASVT